MANSGLFKLILPLDVKSLSMKERIISILIYLKKMREYLDFLSRG